MALAWYRTEEAGNVAIKGGEAMTVHPHKGASMLRAVVMSPLPIRRCQLLYPVGKAFRNVLLKVLGISYIRNLDQPRARTGALPDGGQSC